MRIYNREMAAGIIDLFDDFLDDKKIVIPNQERDEQEDNAENSTNICGKDFDMLMNGIVDTLGKYGIHIAKDFNMEEPYIEDGSFSVELDSKASARIRITNEFSKLVDGYTIKPGSYNVVVENTTTIEDTETQGDVHAGDTWNDFCDWLIGDMEEMEDIGMLPDLSVTSIEYAGTDNIDLTWDDLCELADGAEHLSTELKAKDEARAQLRDLFKSKGYGDIELAESPEEEIERILSDIAEHKKGLVGFDNRGNLTFVE